MTDNALATIEDKAKKYQAFVARLNHTSATIRKKIKATTDPLLSELEETVNAMNEIEEEIKRDLLANKSLFNKPKTKVINGLKLGFRKGKGKLIINDEVKLIKLLERDYHDDIGALVKTEKKVVKAGLEKLEAKELKRLGVTIQAAGDQIVFDQVEDTLDEFIRFVFDMKEAQ